jgi:hypothetical protein
MLTTEALEERAWAGLNTLRRFLGGKRHEFENGLYPTSISDSDFDLFRRFAVLAALVVHERETLVTELRAQSEEQRGASVRATMSDLDTLGGTLRALSSRLNSLAEEVRRVQSQVSSSA